jgi:hypothetical protein
MCHGRGPPSRESFRASRAQSHDCRVRCATTYCPGVQPSDSIDP